MTDQPKTAAGRALLGEFATDWADRLAIQNRILAIETEAAAYPPEPSASDREQWDRIVSAAQPQPSGALREALERLADAADQPLTINSGDDSEWDELREAVEQARAALARPAGEQG